MIAHLDGDCLSLWCPGCNAAHSIAVGPWTWNRDLDRPDIVPAILTWGVSGIRCHGFVKAGTWRFLPDCRHPLAGQTVACVPWPEESQP